MATQQELTDDRNQRFLELLEPIYKDCERWAFSRTQNRVDAQDVLQQSILTALESFHQLKNEAAFKTWIFRIISNTHRLMIRQSKRSPDPVDPEILSSVHSQAEEWEAQQERSRVIRQVLSRLSEEQRNGLMLFEMFNFSIREVAEILGKKEGAVRVLLHRARDRVAAMLDELEDDIR